MRLHEIKCIKTKRLTLRPFCIDDVYDIYEWCSDPHVVKYLSFKKHDNIDETREVLKNILSFDSLAIVEDNADKCIGSFGLVVDNITNAAEFGYALNKDYWRYGYMSETIEVLIEWLQSNTQVRVLVAEINFNNFRSAQLLEKNGFNYIGEGTKEMPLKNEIWRIKKYQLNL